MVALVVSYLSKLQMLDRSTESSPSWPGPGKMVNLCTCFVLFVLTINPDGGATPSFVDRSQCIPDFCQTNPEGRFPEQGAYFCGPVAVSNSLVALARNGFPKLRPNASGDHEAQIKLIHQLASSGYINTVGKHGTNPPRLMLGVKRFIEECGYQIERLEQQGWMASTSEFPALRKAPSLEWIRQTFQSERSAVWLNVGWYTVDRETGTYRRFAGHWVTLVGYGKDQNGQEDSATIMIHDPSPRTGTTPVTQHIKLVPLKTGILERNLSPTHQVRQKAEGFFEMKGEMRLKTGADAAILDAAVVLVIRDDSL